MFLIFKYYNMFSKTHIKRYANPQIPKQPVVVRGVHITPCPFPGLSWSNLQRDQLPNPASLQVGGCFSNLYQICFGNYYSPNGNLCDHQAPWQLWSHPACSATWPSGELCLSQVLLVGMLPEASRKGIAQTHLENVVFISSRSTFRSWEPSQERSLVLLEGLITSSRCEIE